MQLNTLEFDQTSLNVLSQAYDCIWIWLAPRTEPTPLRGDLLQGVDWSLRGAISRYLIQSDFKRSGTVFFPSKSLLGAPLVAVESSENVNWDLFERNAQGTELANILALCEDPKTGSEIKKGLSKIRSQTYPKVIDIAVRLAKNSKNIS